MDKAKEEELTEYNVNHPTDFPGGMVYIDG